MLNTQACKKKYLNIRYTQKHKAINVESSMDCSSQIEHKYCVKNNISLTLVKVSTL